ncbi:unnamed protein product [Prorocentrum cordatum]|uniref:Uncharacterized protein n=1 Tax=Prorocentrum cordatum TaxID=2364126 RepID=A0ABN9VUR7_9DINO|nr:unnamed protein product [Polarella glacialis]
MSFFHNECSAESCRRAAGGSRAAGRLAVSRARVPTAGSWGPTLWARALMVVALAFRLLGPRCSLACSHPAMQPLLAGPARHAAARRMSGIGDVASTVALRGRGCATTGEQRATSNMSDHGRPAELLEKAGDVSGGSKHRALAKPPPPPKEPTLQHQVSMAHSRMRAVEKPQRDAVHRCEVWSLQKLRQRGFVSKLAEELEQTEQEHRRLVKALHAEAVAAEEAFPAPSKYTFSSIPDVSSTKALVIDRAKFLGNFDDYKLSETGKDQLGKRGQHDGDGAVIVSKSVVRGGTHQVSTARTSAGWPRKGRLMSQLKHVVPTKRPRGSQRQLLLMAPVARLPRASRLVQVRWMWPRRQLSCGSLLRGSCGFLTLSKLLPLRARERWQGGRDSESMLSPRGDILYRVALRRRAGDRRRAFRGHRALLQGR